MEMDVEQPRSNIIALHGTRIPEMLGTFHLDDHNVQEWSDYNGPGMKHRARKEIGKWIDRDRNADIKFQRHEDSKRSDTSQEQQRTEVIQGNAPDAAFQIIRSQRQFQDSDDKSGRVTTMSTSYQMSTTRGIRSTSKTTSNKTTTKTVTVSGGRSDDFENLKMSFQPLDTSTQRERINMSRSGTMGVRRPPTRRHTPAAAILSSSPDELQEEDGEENHHHNVIVMNHESEDTSATIMTENGHKNTDSSTTTPVPILGLKNLSSKIRVGFPVEIQLELQSKLRYSNGEENGVIIHTEDDEDVDAVGRHDNVDIKEIVEEEQLFEDEKGTEMNSRVISSSSKLSNNSTVMINQSSKSTSSSSSSSILGPKPTTSLLRGGNSSWQESKTTKNESNKELSKPGVNESAESLLLFRPSSYNNNSNHHQDNNENFTFDYSEEQKRRKSYGFESFNPHNNNDTSTHTATTTPSSASSRRPAGDVPVPQLSDDNDDDVNNDVSSRIAPYLHERLASNIRRLSPSPSLSRSWDLIQSVANHQQGREERKKLFLSSSHLDSISSARNPGSNLKTAFSPTTQRSIVNLNPFGEVEDSEFPPEPHDSLESPRNRSPERSLYTGSSSYLRPDTFERPLTKVGSTPDIIHHNIELEPATLSDKSRHLMTMLNETPDLLNKMSSKKHKMSDLSPAPDKRPENDRNSRDNKFNDDFNHINETLSRLLEKSNNNIVKGSNNKVHHDSSASPPFTFGHNITGKAKILRGDQLLAKTYENDGIAATSTTITEDESVKKQTQVSHTWISSADQHKPSQRARDNDVTTSISATNDPYRKAQKKVEFCKTEVHFTPDSGKFHIVETDENKPSTVHLFRRKKREKKGSSSFSSSIDTKKLEIIGKEQKEKTEETKKEKLQTQHQQQQQQQLHLNSFNKKPFTSESSSTTSPSSLRNPYSKEGDSTALELVLGENALVDVVGVDGNKNTLFHHQRHWSTKEPEEDDEEDEERAAGEELGIDEQTVTPTTITPALTPNKFQQEETLSLNNSNQRSTTTTTTTTRDQHQILNFKPFEDEGENISFLPKRQYKSKESTLIDDALISSKGIISRTHVLNNKTTTNRFISEPLVELDKADGSSGDSDNNVNGDFDDYEEEDDARSDDTATLRSNYGELKIQRYLKQLKHENSGRDSPISLSSPSHILPTDVDQQELHVDDEEDDANEYEDDDLGQFRYDSAYENGSFVPLATRRSLIEMNNRNRTKNKSNSHASDNSSTTSNYSLPLSDRDKNSQSNNNGDYHHPSSLKLKTMEAIIDTKSHKPQITSVDLRYGFSPNDPSSYFNEPVKRNFKINKLGEDDDDDEGSNDAEPYEVISEPVKPEIKSLPPFRTSRLSLTSFNDAQEETLFKQKPPVPILPSKFSSFEKTGAALRERFNAKTTVRPKPDGKEATMSFVDGKPPSVYTSPTYVPSKSVVKIGGEEDQELSAGNVKIRIESDDRLRTNHDDQISMDQEMNSMDSLLDNNNHHHAPEPILSMDHTWKGPAHFDNHHHHHHHHHHHNQSTSKTASVARSLTFPKSSRPEPEWVAKAKSRETRIKDWNLIGKQQYGTARKSEPPWITEIKFKSKLGRSSPTPETKSLLIGSIVYPWEKERDYDSREGPTAEPPSIDPQIRVQSPETPSISAPTDPMGHQNVIITELPDDETEIMADHFVTKNTTARDTISLPPPKPERSNQDQRSPAVIGQQKGLSDSLERKLMAPLMESSKRSPRKPLQTSSTVNKSGGPNSNGISRLTPHEKPRAPPRPPKPPQRVSSLTNKSQTAIPPPLLSADEKRSNSRASSPSDKRSAVPPPPQPHPRTTGIPTPSPPEKRTYGGSSNGPSSHHQESRTSTPQKSRRNNNNSHSNVNSDLEDSIIITPRNNNTPIHNHPLVKVAKIPSARSTHAVPKNVASPEGRSSGMKHNKAKHHVVTTETKIACKSKLMDGQATGVKETEASSPRLGNPSHRPLPKVPPPRAPTAVSPLRNRQINITNNNNG